jgi:hypothetical protein
MQSDQAYNKLKVLTNKKNPNFEVKGADGES